MTSAAGPAATTRPDEDPPGGPPVALRVEGLTVTYTTATRTVVAVRGVDLEIGPGRCLGLVGESGSGKSTVGSAVQGLLTRDAVVGTEGTVQIAGHRLDPSVETGWAPVRGHLVTTVFQDPMSSLDPTMTVGRMLTHVTGDPGESATWLDRVEISSPRDVLRSYPHQLSGGMRQRVMIALALARRPALLVADEPTTALDVGVQAQILRLIDRRRAELGCAVLFVTHDLGVARSVCDEVAVMRRGEVEERGAADQVFTAPTSGYARRLMASRLTLGTDRTRPLGLPEASVVASMREAAVVRSTAAGQHRAQVVDRADAPAPTAEQLRERWTRGELTWDEFTAPAPDRRRPPALELAKVTKSFSSGGLFGGRTRTVLHDVDLAVRHRESVALVGGSGSGKTTILRIAAGLERADSGDVVVDDRAGRGVQVVPQDAGASLTPWRTVGQLLLERLTNTAEGRALDPAARAARVALALERVALDPGIADVLPGALSGGQRQRVAIARAVVVPPAVLLCDEPTSALDVQVACTVLNLLTLLRHDLGLSILFVTHDLAAARVVADRIDVIADGRIVERVPSDDLSTALTSDYGRRLLDAVLP